MACKNTHVDAGAGATTADLFAHFIACVACVLRNFARRVASRALRNAVEHKLALAFLDIAPREWDAGTVPRRHRAMLQATEIVMSLKEFAMNNLGIRPGLVQSTVAKFENGTKNGAADGAQKQSPARSKGQLDGLSSFKGADGAPPPPPSSRHTIDGDGEQLELWQHDS